MYEAKSRQEDAELNRALCMKLARNHASQFRNYRTSEVNAYIAQLVREAREYNREVIGIKLGFVPEWS